MFSFPQHISLPSGVLSDSRYLVFGFTFYQQKEGNFGHHPRLNILYRVKGHTGYSYRWHFFVA